MTNIPDLTATPNAERVIKRLVPVPTVFATADGICQTLEGPVAYRGGDAILTGVRGEHWPVQRHLFLAAYTPDPPVTAGQDGIYRKNPSITLALRIEHAMDVPVGWQADPLHARPGDWLLRYEDGSHGVITDAVFRETYEPAPT